MADQRPPKLTVPIKMRHLTGPNRTDEEFRKAIEDRRKAKKRAADS
jgi:hypothetical protein